MKGFMYQIFDNLGIKPDNYRILINLPRKIDVTTRKSMLKLLFDVFQVPVFSLFCKQLVKIA